MSDINTLLSDAVSFQKETTSQFNTNMKALSDNVERAAKDFSDAKTTMDNAEKAIDGAIHDTASKNANLRAIVKGTGNDSILVNADIQTLRADVAALKERVGKAKELEAIRDEQTRSLADRNEANLHSSWLGLLRPLRDESRMGLIIAGMAFLLLALGGLYFLYRMGFFTRGDSGAIPDFFQGGFRSVMKRFHR